MGILTRFASIDQDVFRVVPVAQTLSDTCPRDPFAPRVRECRAGCLWSLVALTVGGGRMKRAAIALLVAAVVASAGGSNALAEQPTPEDGAPPTGTLTVTSQPPAARVYLDGAFAGTTPAALPGTVAGAYRVTVKADGYEAWSQKVAVYAGEELQVSASLVPRPGAGAVPPSPNLEAEDVPSDAAGPRTWTDPISRMEFVRIPGGCYLMGSPFSETGAYSAEGPQHEVCVDSFWMGKTEVTNAQYRQYKASHDSGSYKSLGLNGDNQPVVSVSWNEVQEYIQWLSRSTGRQFRLPTEAEWECAARGGTTQTRFWGDDPSRACEYANVKDQTAQQEWPDWTTIHECRDRFAAAAHVGRFQPNAFGLHDMLGNVEEMCADWFAWDYYVGSPLDNPTGPPSGTKRVARGGTWSYVPQYVRAASRNEIDPGERGGVPPTLGFRLVTQ